MCVRCLCRPVDGILVTESVVSSLTAQYVAAEGGWRGVHILKKLFV